MQNELKYLAEFRQLLANYKMSEHAKTVLDHTKLVLLVAPTSAGRNTLIKELIKTGDYHYIISDTTRKPRSNNGIPEQNGHEYWFKTEDEVLNELKNGEFLEAAIIHNQQVSGIGIRELEKAARDNKFAITDIEIVGADNVHNAKPDTTIIYVLPPSFEEWLQRLHERGKLPPDELKRRFSSAYQELQSALTKDYYFFVINAEVSAAAAEINNIAHNPAPNPERGNRGRQIAQELYNRLDQELIIKKES